jgi:O-antigen ligase
MSSEVYAENKNALEDKSSLYAKINKIFLSPPLRYALAVAFLSGPFLALIGNAGSDIWLSSVAALFLVRSAWMKDWAWTETMWVRISFLFWAWLIATSAISQWPAQALEQAIPWIRFPIFAAAFVFWMREHSRLRKAMTLSVATGLIIMSGILIMERWQNPTAIRLYGPYDNPKTGWYMLGFGLPFMLTALSKIGNRLRATIVALMTLMIVVPVTFSTGEIYVSVSMVFALGIFLLLGQVWHPAVLTTIAITFLSIFFILSTDYYLFQRFTSQAMERLPWLESSDYYTAWAGGWSAALQNLWIGVGADAYEEYCIQLATQGQMHTLGVDACQPHPHQLYLQVFAETGLPGLILIIGLAIALGLHCIQSSKILSLSKPKAAGLAIIITVFWPISTYSQAFGQHRNFFTWFMIAWALVLSTQILKKDRNFFDNKTKYEK